MLTHEQLQQLADEPYEGRNRLKRARQLAGLTQIDLAARTGFTQGTLSKLEAGLYTDGPTRETMDRLAAVFGATKDLLFPPSARDEAQAS